MKRCALYYLFTFSSALLSAQDFLITTKGDTIKGTINFQLIGKIEMANIKASKRETVSAINTREVFLKGKQFKPVQYNGSILFMQVLTEGYLSLLAFQPPNIMTYDGRLLQKKDGQMLEVPGIGFKKSMAKFFSDFPDLANKISAGELGSRDLTDIIKQYNDFISHQTNMPATSARLDEVTQPTSQDQKSKIELLNSLRTDIEKSDLLQKQDALDILTDWAEKIKTNKSIPGYLSKSLKTSVDLRSEFLIRINELAKP